MMTAAGGPPRKLRVGVLFGGRSGEHAVSLMSARSVMAALDAEKYDIVPIGITPDGRWLAGEALQALAGGDKAAPAATRAVTLLPEPGSSALSTSQTGGRSAITDVDIVLPILHGPYGEDGTVQGLLELANLPYVGAGVVGSAVGMDKGIFKSVMSAHRLPVLPWQLVTVHEWRERPSAVIDRLEEALPYPLFTKPANLGSSVGINRCADRQALRDGLDEAARYDRRIVVEQGIDARELEVAVLGNEEPVASIVGEIRPRRAFYDYVAKYVSDDSELLIPAPLETAVADRVRDLALRAYIAIDCAGLGRADMLLDRADGRIYVNEINTIPGFTRISMYPKLWEASGLPYAQLLDRLIALALERYDQKRHIETTFAPATAKQSAHGQ